MLRFLLTATAMASLLATAAWAGPRPVMPPSPMIEPKAPATVLAPFAQSVTLGRKTVKLDAGQGDGSIDHLASSLGASEVGHMGDGGDSFHWLCFTLPKQRARVWLTAGEGGDIDGVTAQMSDAAPSAACPLMGEGATPVSLDSGVFVGVPAADLTRVLGAPGRSVNDWWVYRRSTDLKTSGLDEDDTLVVHIENGKVVFMQAARSATY